ncbi:MAG: CDP-alcohol phosphatidyltransferase family protein [Arenicellales bacterium]|nr:CDP-alcohol phosphatidyltransferase family protein [Arenicellales bacterium]
MAIYELRNDIHSRIKNSLAPLSRVLTRFHVTPNQVSIAGMLLSVVAAALIVSGRLFMAGLVFLFAGLLDLLDGALAHYQGNSTRFGALLDSTLDRVSEGLILAAITYHFAVLGEPYYAVLTTLALLGSILVSYTRARVESLGATCTIGIATRPERVALLVAGLCADLLTIVIIVLVVATLYTTIQRLKQGADLLSPPYYRQEMRDSPDSRGLRDQK